MKILLSAFVCIPRAGSESGIGWHWAVELARLGHEVWVLTWTQCQAEIETEMCQHPIPNLHFLYYQLPTWVGWWRKGERGIRLYYLLWQWGAYRFAKWIHAKEPFDVVHHVTFGVVRHPSFMGRLGIPFIFGPVAGGERAPWRLRKGYGMRGHLCDTLRDAANALVKIDPLMRLTFRQAKSIVVTSEQTKHLIPRRFGYKVQIQLAIGIDTKTTVHPSHQHQKRSFFVLYVGRFLFWKGMHLGLSAFAGLLQEAPEARLTLVGKGPEEASWRRLAERLGIIQHVEWIPWTEREKLSALYQHHDVLLFPSLHDSGGMVVLEAMAHGLPVVCLDLGGPGIMVNDSCGRVIQTQGTGEKDVIQELGEALVELAKDKNLRTSLRAGALERVQDYAWSKVTGQVYGEAYSGLRIERIE